MDPQAIEELTVHVGVDIQPIGDDTLLWSSARLSSMAERGGQGYQSLSLSDCGNLRVQARRLEDVRTKLDPRLAAVMNRRINFLQMYNTSPHYRPKEFHSISGLLAASLCVHQQVCKST